MIRVIGEAGDPRSHLENRTGEPLANPYLYMAAQIYAGLDGINRNLDPGPPTETPYKKCSGLALPATLEEALAALRASACFRAGFGEDFVDYYARMKVAEVARCRKETTSEQADVSGWEHREYFDML
jgi:glutamine synthetase